MVAVYFYPGPGYAGLQQARQRASARDDLYCRRLDLSVCGGDRSGDDPTAKAWNCRTPYSIRGPAGQASTGRFRAAVRTPSARRRKDREALRFPWQTGGARLWQLHLTAVQAPGRRPQQSLRTLQGPRRVPAGLHPRGSPQRRLANIRESARGCDLHRPQDSRRTPGGG